MTPPPSSARRREEAEDEEVDEARGGEEDDDDDEDEEPPGAEVDEARGLGRRPIKGKNAKAKKKVRRRAWATKKRRAAKRPML